MLLALTAQAASYTTATIDDIVYRLYSETMEAHVYHDKSSTTLNVTNNRLELPEKVTNESKDYMVTEVEYFRCNNTGLTLVIPKTVKTVSSVKKGVKTLVLGAGVTSVSGLSESTNLEGFEIAEGNESFSVDGYGVLYSKDKTKLWYAPYGKRSQFGNYTVPSGVTSINGYAFYYFGQLEKISLPEGLKEIGNSAFYYCEKLVNCKLPSTVETINDYAFYGCGLAGLSLPAQLRTIGEYAFYSGVQNRKLESIEIPQYVEKIGDYAFSYVNIDKVITHCKPFLLPEYNPFGSPTNQTLVVPKGTRDIFSTCQGWKRIHNVVEGDFEPTFDVSEYLMGGSDLDNDGQVISIDGVGYALYRSGVARVYCRSGYALGEYTPAAGVNSLTIPESVYFRALTYKVDGVEYFSSKSVIDLQLPTTVTFVDNVKKGVKILKLPKSVTSVSGLSESTNLEGFEIAEGNESFSVDSYGVLYSKDKTKLWYAPYAKRSTFATYTVPDAVTVIGQSAFRSFRELVKVSLPDGLKEIGNSAFYYCEKLVSCKLPSTVETISDYAFYYCELAGLSLPAQLRTIGEYAFGSGVQNRKLESIEIPQYVQKIGDYAFYNVTIGTIYSRITAENLLPIGTYSFSNQSKIPLVVPTGSLEMYKLMSGWSTFSNITESDALLPSAVKCGTPKFTRKGNTLTITSEPVDASIYYTTDGRQPTASSMLYEGAITPTKNCTILAIAMKEGIENSDVASYVVDWFKVETPTFELKDNKLTIKTETEGASIYYTLGADAVPSAINGILYTAPIELTDNRVVRAIAVKDGFDDSDIAEYAHGGVACPTPIFEKYDGRYFTITPINGATIHYTIDGTTPTQDSPTYDGRSTVTGLCTIKAVAFSDVKNPSDVAAFEVTYFYGGEEAQLTEAGTLEKAFEWCGTQDMKELAVHGPLNATDLSFVKEKLNALQHLDLSESTIADHQLPNEAFAGMQLISFTSPTDVNSVGDRIFANCQQLAAVVWNASEKIPANSFGENVNPNMLIYVPNRVIAPSNIRNVISNGSATSIVLSDAEGNNNFYCPIAFRADKISYTHNYSMQTAVGKCMGWETIVLPFTVQKIAHESKGDIIPYNKFEQEGSSEAARPFWLRRLTETGFEDAAEIEANVPYIISMPNSSEYAARYNLAGNVTFSAEKVEIPVTKTTRIEKGSVSLVSTYVSESASRDIWAINRNEVYEGNPEGSVFVPNLREVRPFEAYVTTKTMSGVGPFLSIADMGGNGTTGIEAMLNEGTSDYEGSWFLLDGQKLQGKPTKKGVYIVNGKKVVLK